MCGTRTSATSWSTKPRSAEETVGCTPPPGEWLYRWIAATPEHAVLRRHNPSSRAGGRGDAGGDRVRARDDTGHHRALLADSRERDRHQCHQSAGHDADAAAADVEARAS